MKNNAQEPAGAAPTGREVAELLARKNVCVRAGAGTGKTRLLVDLYLEMLSARRAAVSEIAALTFTEKAAGEMKERIRAACVEQEGRAPDPQVRHHWRTQRYQLESADIGTIHGFCSRLLREFPIQAGIDPQFQVLDELSADALARDAIREALAEMLDKESTEVLELLRYFSRGELERALAYLLTEREKLEGSNALADGPLEARNRVWSLIGARLGRFLSSPDWQAMASVLGKKRSRKRDDPLEQKRLGVLQRIEKLGTSEDPEERTTNVSELLELLKSAARSGRKENWKEDDLQEVRGTLARLKELLAELAPFAELPTDRQKDEEIFQLTGFLGNVYQKASQAYRTRKAEVGVLDYSDLLIDAYRLLGANRPVRQNIQRQFKRVLRSSAC